MKAKSVLKWVGIGILGIAAVFLFIFAVMHLWNWLVPELFNGPVLSYWQAAGLMLLAKILFAGFSPGCHSKDHSHKHDYWRKRYQDKCGRKEEVPGAEAI